MPVAATKNGQTAFTVQQLGTQIDSKAVATTDGRFDVTLTITDRSFSPGPAFLTFISSKSMTLRDGETTQYTTTDSATKEVLTVDVTLAVQK